MKPLPCAAHHIGTMYTQATTDEMRALCPVWPLHTAELCRICALWFAYRTQTGRA